MDSFDIVNLKIEKASKVPWYSQLQKITALLRFIELCMVLILISRFSTQLPATFRLSGEYFRGLSMTLFSPQFVFIVGNAIVIVLFIKSGHYYSTDDQDDTKNRSRIYDDLYNEDVGKNRNSHRERNEYRRKQSMSDKDSTMVNTYGFGSKEKIVRSHSELYCVKLKGGRELRRSATERCLKNVNYGEKAAGVEEELSSEEFRRTVEAFVARQQKFLREDVLFKRDVFQEGMLHV